MNQHPSKIARNEEIVCMRFAKNLTWRRISEAHGISIATARSIVLRYRKRLMQNRIHERFGVPNEDRK